MVVFARLCPCMTTDRSRTLLLQTLCSVAIDAGRIALDVRDQHYQIKGDGSPVTAADLACDAFITAALQKLEIAPVISEEASERMEVAAGVPFWLVDPLDGTKEFLKESGEFTVNIALIERSRAVVGVVHAPAIGATYYAAEGVGAFKRDGGNDVPIRVRQAGNPLRLAVSRDHITPQEVALTERLAPIDVVPMGSSLKFCLVAEGSADLYVRYGRTREWDTAAAQCVLECAGGSVVDAGTGERLSYGKNDLVNPSFLAFGDRAAAGRVLADG
jgi:3'(2'), 5'-bisphosphate nucleotidase